MSCIYIKKAFCQKPKYKNDITSPWSSTVLYLTFIQIDIQSTKTLVETYNLYEKPVDTLYLNCNDLVTWPGYLTWSPDTAHNLIRAIPRSHEFSSPHRRHHLQTSPKTSDRSALHFYLQRPSSLCKRAQYNISTKAPSHTMLKASPCTMLKIAPRTMLKAAPRTMLKSAPRTMLKESSRIIEYW